MWFITCARRRAVHVILPNQKERRQQVMEFGYCKYLLRDALCWMDASIKLKRELFAETKRVKFGKFKDFKRRNRTNLDLLYPAPNLFLN